MEKSRPSSTMPIVDMTKEFNKLSASDQHFVKKLEKMNMNRAMDMKKMRTRNKLTGITIGLTVIGIYAYTILSVKQEKFLDDFDKSEVKKVSP